uniref:RNA polymerase beta'' subunit n=1 Tax=Rhodospora sordida TaxID=362230 RepID=UPI001FCD5FE9|nr:RNA polymerase beta'' subunit [Rhodospora sordida]UNJ15038.1 RNA polymerase beta'' subunit [Rhodospora sordida]
MSNNMVKPSPYYNKIIDKKELKILIRKAFRHYGIAAATNMADSLKDLGFQYATKAGFSLSLEDLRIPPYKRNLLNQTYANIKLAEHKYLRGEITTVERFQKVIDTWSNASETLKNEVITYFKNTDPLNPVYIMAFSGARGNISQVRQLVGMRGLMSDPSGQIIDIPIASNFREGLNVTEYFISSYGARKGLVDTALRTADSGYLTRRLVDVAQDVIIREVDCYTKRGIPILDPNVQQILGRVLVENLYHPITGSLIGSFNQDINLHLAEEIIKSKIRQLLVRSPLTCESNNSICQYCYGWSLAHDRLVDLGEAVGIIAAQSIGEPGTQLTMRTFHTGGVFTGEIAKRILSNYTGKVIFDETIKLSSTRTRHGDIASTITESLPIVVQDASGNFIQQFTLPEGSTLFIKNKQNVNQDDVLAELPIGKRLGKEKAYKQITTDIAGQVYFTDLTIEETQNKQQTRKVSQSGGLIWILSGKVYNIPYNAEIIVRSKEKIQNGQTIANIKIINQYSGKILIPQDSNQFNPVQEIHIVTSAVLFAHPIVYMDRFENNKVHLLETSSGDKFVLRNLYGQKLSHYQVIGDLIANTYKTQTGGMIKYLDLPVAKCTLSNQDNFEVRGGGYILWVEEETHEINKDVSLLLVKQGEIIEGGTEIVKNIFGKNSGIVEIIQKDDIIREIVIKPGRLVGISENLSLKKKRRGFLRPGENLADVFEADNIIYWEYLKINDQYFILVRPVSVYSVPDSIPSLEKDFITKSDQGLGLKVTRNICFKDGEKVRSVNGVELIKTQLVTIIPELDSNLVAKVQLNRFENELEQVSSLQIKLVILETLGIDNKAQQRNDNQKTILLVENDQYVKQGTVIAKTEIIAQELGTIDTVYQDLQNNKRILNLIDSNFYQIKADSLHLYLKESQWIRMGDKITNKYKASCSGQVVSIDKNSAVIRLARPYLLSPNTVLYINNKALVQPGEVLAGLTYEVFKTGDIVQGLPRIEEILEVRKKAEGTSNPHVLLENKFLKYLQGKLELHDAARLSIQEVQLFLIEAIQSVYRSQGVEIADKHIEIIVKQMSSKVRIKSGGDTGYLPGDLVEIQKTERQNETMQSISKEPSLYNPLLLGITKASLNTDSFISAASFQETTKILTEAAISGKLDWLKGLKENVIIGRLIPAGTGFGSYVNKSNNTYSSFSVADSEESMNTKSNVDDIILDDRSFRKYPFHNFN